MMGKRKQGVVAHNVDGRLEYFVPAPDGGFSHLWQNLADDGWGGMSRMASQWLGTTVGEVNIAGWSHWGRVGGPVATKGIAVARNADGRLEAFAWSHDGRLHHTWQDLPGGNFGGWLTFE
jgi:hypothetical protein